MSDIVYGCLEPPPIFELRGKGINISMFINDELDMKIALMALEMSQRKRKPKKKKNSR